MKFLILSCSTGEGHNSAAKALAHSMTEHGDTAVIVDPVSFGGERAQSFVTNWYNRTLERRPAVFGAVYRAGALYERIPGKSPVYAANALYAEKLAGYMEKEGFDAVVYTHLYGGEALTSIEKRGLLKTPVFAVLTDYTSIPFFAETKADLYFIPHRDVEKELVKKRVPAKKLIASGIPVHEKFVQAPPKDEARRRISVPMEKRVYLLMSGGVGCGKLKELAEDILKLEDGSSKIFILSGRNQTLFQELSQSFEREERVKTVPFTEDVALYMSASDVAVTKPGGLSSTELAVIGVPMVHLIAVNGCERRNAAFFSSHGLSFFARSVNDAAKKAVFLARHPKEREKMIEKQRREINRNSAEEVYRAIKEYTRHE